MYQTARANEITMRRFNIINVAGFAKAVIRFYFRMLEESGLLHEEPAKLFPDLQMTPETKTRTTKSKRTPFVKGSKQALSAASSGTSSSSNQTKQLNRRSSDVNEVYLL